jgi:hypothetical protein
MNLNEYFSEKKGTGVLATCDAEGNVDLALYSRPYIIDEDTIAFSMLERLSRFNLESNPKAAYMFIEEGPGYKGTRLYLAAVGEETDHRKIDAIKKQAAHKSHATEDQPRHFVYFKVRKNRPLVGDAKDQ